VIHELIHRVLSRNKQIKEPKNAVECGANAVCSFVSKRKYYILRQPVLKKVCKVRKPFLFIRLKKNFLIGFAILFMFLYIITSGIVIIHSKKLLS
jgi:hypothetical protein